MKKTINTLKVILYYLIIFFILYKIIYFIWINFIFSCKIEDIQDMDCLWVVISSDILAICVITLFIITDWILFKSYKKFIK
jgi:hypothetical protein